MTFLSFIGFVALGVFVGAMLNELAHQSRKRGRR